jgi:pilus assembly protein Flp/PilA
MNLQMIVNWLQARFSSEERGAALVEYGLLVALIAVFCVLAITAVGTSVRDVFNDIAGDI